MRLCFNMSTEISYELIKNDFYYADYLGFKIVMLKSVGYINASKLCKKAGKKLKHCLELKDTQDLISSISQKIMWDSVSSFHPRSVCVEMHGIKGGENENIRGVYIHPLLIPYIANWISNGFGFVVSHIVDDLMGKRNKVNSIILEEKLQTVTKELMITLSNMMLLQRNNETLVREKKVLTTVYLGYKRMLEDSSKSFSNFFTVLNSTTDMLKSTSESLAKTRKRLHSSSEENGFALVLKNCCVEALPYYVIRCRNENMVPSLKRIQSKYPNSRVSFTTDYVLNGNNLFHKLKEIPNAKSHLNHYDPGCSEEEICGLLYRMCNE
jgi:KilA-N domain/Protein of unknown function (DUF3627)